MSPKHDCSVKGCGKRAAGYCDGCEEPRCQDHGNGSLCEENGQGDYWGCSVHNVTPHFSAYEEMDFGACQLLSTVVVA